MARASPASRGGRRPSRRPPGAHQKLMAQSKRRVETAGRPQTKTRLSGVRAKRRCGKRRSEVRAAAQPLVQARSAAGSEGWTSWNKETAERPRSRIASQGKSARPRVAGKRRYETLSRTRSKRLSHSGIFKSSAPSLEPILPSDAAPGIGWPPKCPVGCGSTPLRLPRCRRRDVSSQGPYKPGPWQHHGIPVKAWKG